MSRTDKTRPWWVKVREHAVKYPRRTEPLHHQDRYWLGELRCGCAMCQDQDGRKQQARRSRYAGRREARTVDL